jgi:hypothetical protein
MLRATLRASQVVAAVLLFAMGLLRLVGMGYAQQEVCPPSLVPDPCSLTCEYWRSASFYSCSTKGGPKCCQYESFVARCYDGPNPPCWGTFEGRILIGTYYGVECNAAANRCPGFPPPN